MFRNIFGIKQVLRSLQKTRQTLNFLDKRHLWAFSKNNVNLIDLTKNLRAQSSGKGFEVNTNVLKDILIFKYDNPKFYNILNIFAICQFFFWNYLSHFSFTTLKDAPPPIKEEEKDLPLWRKINLGDNKYRYSITIFCFMIGYGILASSWLFTLRSVRFLVLKKGGTHISLITYGPFNKNRIMDVPIKYVSAQESRAACKVQLPLKVKNKSLYYVLDMRGEFLNSNLFDKHVGLKRKL